MLHHGYGEVQQNKSEHSENHEHSYDTDLVIDKDREESPYIVKPHLTMSYLKDKYINKGSNCLNKTCDVAMVDDFSINEKLMTAVIN